MTQGDNMPQSILLILFCILSFSIESKEIGFIEQFALSENRQQTLKQLIPGTEDYDYYSALHYQNTGQYDKVRDILKKWIKRTGITTKTEKITTRQLLLDYDQHPHQTLTSLKRKLNLHFNHTQTGAIQQRQLPSHLDSNKINTQQLGNKALQRDYSLHPFETTAFYWLSQQTLSAAQQRDFLKRLKTPDVDHLIEMIVADLNENDSPGFGAYHIHQQLLLNQLDQLARLKPDLMNDKKFIDIYLSKLKPNPDIDIINNLTARQHYFEMLWRYVKTLSKNQNTIKANVLFQLLSTQQKQNEYNLPRFLTYLKLPRDVHYINHQYYRSNRYHRVNLYQSINALSIPQIDNDEPLVKQYLQHFFLRDQTYKPFERFISSTYLKNLFAETMLVNGVGHSEKWAAMLSPELLKTLKNRIDLDFAVNNPSHFKHDDKIELDVWIKNINKLIVNVYRINAFHYFKTQQKAVSTDIDLDGLVANHERQFSYTESPLKRVKHHFQFSMINKPGIYIIDFIGNGKSSRALIHKGNLQHRVRTTPSGQVFQLFDDHNQTLTNTSLWLAGHDYQSDPDGLINVPYSNHPGQQSVILRHGEQVSLAKFNHQAEQYKLHAGFHVNRESLISGNQANVIIRPVLKLNQTPISLAKLESVKLTIISMDQSDTTTEKTQTITLTEDQEATISFRVPENLKQLTFTLAAKVKQHSQNKTINLNDQATFKLNLIDLTDQIIQIHLGKNQQDYYLDVTGKNGEPQIGKAIKLRLKHRFFKSNINTTLQTDTNGQIFLGELDQISHLKAKHQNHHQYHWQLLENHFQYPQRIHKTTGQTIEIPYDNNQSPLKRENIALFSMNNQQTIADYFDHLQSHNGRLNIKALPAGDYRLHIKNENTLINIRIGQGHPVNDYLITAKRHLEIPEQTPAYIQSITRQANNIQIKLGNHTDFTRLHLITTRYVPAYDIFSNLALSIIPGPLMTYTRQKSSYFVTGRDIGDEYRYVLERKYQKKYPGNLLKRPGLLLTPWALGKTQTSQQEAKAGSAFKPIAAAEQELSQYGSRDKRTRTRKAKIGDFVNLDYLPDTQILTNLTADQQGVITISKSRIKSQQILHIVLADPGYLSVYPITSTYTNTKPDYQDKRLLEPLNADQHFTEQKKISIIQPGQSVSIRNPGSAKYEIYDHLGKVYQLLKTIHHSKHLDDFEFITQWPSLSEQDQQQHYAKYACHELNFFLYHKDSGFFQKTIKPFLKNKNHKTFLDHWLLEENLEKYQHPWAYQQLNSVEKILLTQRLKQDQVYTQRFLKDALDMLPPDPEQFNRLFNIAIKSTALDMTAIPTTPEWEMDASTTGQSISMRSVSSNAAPAMLDSMMAQASKPSGRTLSLGKNRKKKAYFAKAKKQKSTARQFYRKLDKTQEWAENNYYKLPIKKQNADLITINAFWYDYVTQFSNPSFMSTHIAQASRNFTEIMMALAVIDLPFNAEPVTRNHQPNKLILQTKSAAILFHQAINSTQTPSQQQTLLVSQNHFKYNDRYQYHNNERQEKYITRHFTPQTVYGTQVIISNPTSTIRKLDALLQIPQGAIPVNHGLITETRKLTLEPYHTHKIEYYYYFPMTGQYTQFPVHISTNGQLLAYAKPFAFDVSHQQPHKDPESWEYLSQQGDLKAVLTYLKTHNINRINLDKIAFRMQKFKAFKQITDLLDQAHFYHPLLWSYGIKHNDLKTIRTYLKHQDQFISKTGISLNSTLLTINPVERKIYQHLEYSPLVNARQHPLSKNQHLLNDKFYQQYHQLLEILSFQKQLNNEDKMSITYYLLLQDRIEEAIHFFKKIKPAHLATPLQYDYIKAYLALYQSDIKTANATIKQYVNYPNHRWQRLFQALQQHILEINQQAFEITDAQDRNQQQTQATEQSPSLNFDINNRQIQLTYQNVKTLTVNYYLIDLELLFSNQPFAQKHSNRYSTIYPNHTQTIAMPNNKQQYSIDIPKQYKQINVMIEVSAAGLTRSKPNYAHGMAIQLIENYGQLKIKDSHGKPLKQVYIKVYAQYKNAKTRFYKDGYTDLAGRFDYTSLNTDELSRVKKFSMLIASEHDGATVKEAMPPKM